MTAVSHLACRAIDVYQRHVSPHKGFRCAFRVLHGGDSCSSFGKRAIARVGLRQGFRLTWRRLQRCRLAYRVLDYQMPGRGGGDVPRGRRGWRSGGWGGGWGAACSEEQVACCAAETFIETVGCACCWP